jgi:folylpolyglutamate synthase/dihydropteroate synthase
MTIVLTVKERLTKIETELAEFKQQLNKLETNHLPHIQSKLDSIDDRLAKLENTQKNKLSSRDRAVVYGSFITAASLIIIELIKALPI